MRSRASAALRTSRAPCRARSRRCCATSPTRKVWRVRLDEPAWWYREPPSGIATVPAPLGGALRLASPSARYRRATPYRSRLPVICVGNFTAGGTGKTPLVIDLSRAPDGGRPRARVPDARLRRAARRARTGSTPTPTRHATSATSPCCSPASRQRSSRATAAPAHAPSRRGPRPAPSSSWTTACKTRRSPRTCRSPSSTAARGHRQWPGDPGRTAARAARLPARARRRHRRQRRRTPPTAQRGRVAAASLSRPGAAREPSPRPSDTGWLAGQRVVAFAGIANRRSGSSRCSKRSARKLGGCACPFRDHQRLERADAERLLAARRQRRATLVTTAKDLARLDGARRAGRAGGATRALPIELCFADATLSRLDAR